MWQTKCELFLLENKVDTAVRATKDHIKFPITFVTMQLQHSELHFTKMMKKR